MLPFSTWCRIRVVEPGWTAAEAVTEIRRGLNSYRWPWAQASVEAGEDRALVVFEVADRPGKRYGVYYSLRHFPIGPMTGVAHESVAHWAGEVPLDLMELVETGGLDWAEQIPGPSGVTLLRWWTGDSVER